MMDRDAISKIRALHADTLDILSAFRSIATTEISDGETIHGTVIDTLARQADQMLTEAGEILDDLTRHTPALDTSATVAVAGAEEASNVLTVPGRVGSAMLDLGDAEASVRGILAGTFGLRDLLASTWPPAHCNDYRRAALWAVEELEACAENAIGRLEEGIGALSGQTRQEAAE